MDVSVTIEDVDDPQVAGLIARHLGFATAVTPARHVHALGTDELRGPDVTLYGLRSGADLVAIGALRGLDDGHAELKSMHVAEHARGQGLGRRLLAELVDAASAAGVTRLSLETGTGDAFAAARSLYLGAGFEPCPPFGGYTANPHSICLTRVVS